MSAKFSQRELRDAFSTFTTGVTVVTAVRPDGEPVGATVNSFASVSLDPPLLLWCLANTSGSLAAFTVGAPFAVHVLSHEQRELALHFARRGRAKFDADRHWRANPHPPHLADVLARFDCRVRSLHSEGDHLIVVGAVTALTRHAGRPLAFYAGKFGSFEPDRGAPGLDMWEIWRGEWF